MFLRRFGNVVMSHVRDSQVFHTVDNRVFFEIPLYGEKNLEILHVSVDDRRISIKTRVRQTSVKSEQTPPHPLETHSLKSEVPGDPLSQSSLTCRGSQSACDVLK
jgi:hypothetical protein